MEGLICLLVVLLILLGVGLPLTALVAAARAERRIDALLDRLSQLERDMAALVHTGAVEPNDWNAAANHPSARATDDSPQMDSTAPPVSLPPVQPQETTGEQRTADEQLTSELPDEGISVDVDRVATKALAPEELEAHVTTRIAAWLGAIALFLAAGFFVKWTFDAGLLGPAVRCVLGAIFGTALVICGEPLRKRDGRVAEGLTAAGLGALYAVTLAASNLYHFVGPTLGFLLLATITAAAVALSLRHGPFVATLGLVGGFVTPGLIDSPEPQAAPLFGYLFLLQVGLCLVGRSRKWNWLSLIAGVAATIWTLLWTATQYAPADAALLESFVLVSFGVAIFSGRTAPTAGNETLPIDTTRVLAGILALVSLATLVHAGRFSSTDWLFLGFLSTGSLIVARLDRRSEALAWLAAGCVALLLIGWPWRTPGWDAGRFGWVSLGFALLFAGGAYAAMWGSAAPQRWSLLSLLSTLTAVLIAYGRLPDPPTFGWGACCLLAALGFAIAAAPLLRPRTRARMGEQTLAILLIGATGFIALASMIELERRLLPAAFALEAPALVMLFLWLRVKALPTFANLISLGALLATSRIVALDGIIQGGILWNDLLLMLGAPAATSALCAHLLRRNDDQAGRVQQVLATVATCLLVTLEIRHAFVQPAALLRGEAPHLGEAAAYLNGWLLLALALERLSRRAAQDVARAATHVLVTLALGVGGFAVLIVLNPLWNSDPVGSTPVVNFLLWYYGAPALLLTFLGMRISHWSRPEWVLWAQSAALVLVFALVSLEVRQWFHGALLTIQADDCSPSESYAYSAAWVVLGLVLLIGALASHSRAVRVASLIVMVLAVGKVFLVDTASLRDLYRVFSLLGLGASLMVLALIYRRFVFVASDRAASTA